MFDTEKRLIVGSIAEAAQLARSGEIGGVITASIENIRYEAAGHCDQGHEAEALLEGIKTHGLPHHFSRIFHAEGDEGIDLSADPKRVPAAARETLAAAQAMLAASPDKKLLIHCMAGSERSATIALLLIFDETKDMPAALAALYRIRPQAKLHVWGEYFEALFGKENAREIVRYRATREMLAARPAPETPEHAEFVASCRRYGMDLSAPGL